MVNSVPGTRLYEYMKFVGEDLLEFLRKVREGIDHVDSHSERWSIQGNGQTIEAIALLRGDIMPDEPSGSVARYIRDRGLEEEIGAMVYPDRRGDGYGISRYEDDLRLDFSQLTDESDVHFAHKSGFMCKTSATDQQRLRELIAGAIKAS